MKKYFYTDGITKNGPYSKEELKNQKLSRNTKIWCLGMENWLELSNIDELNDIIMSVPPEVKGSNQLTANSIKRIEIKKESPYILPKKKIKGNNKIMWLIGIGLLTVITLIILRIGYNNSDSKLHNEIVTNSYDGAENFEMYYEKYYRDLEFFGIYPKRPKIKIIKFSRLDQLDNTTDIHALSLGCNDDDRIEIYINPSSWETFSKPMRYFLMYHELSHDVLNLTDLENSTSNQGKLMFPAMNWFEKKNMDDFIESYQATFQENIKK